MDQKEVKMMVKAILRSPTDLEWSVSGLGMLRTYLSDEVRLHIWDPRLRVPKVSPIHDHPWALKSQVVGGTLRQNRFILKATKEWLEGKYQWKHHAGQIPDNAEAVEEMWWAPIVCGNKAYTKSSPKEAQLYRMPLEIFREGDVYEQRKEEIHETIPEMGTVTIITRSFAVDRESANVYWRGDKEWIDAAPRPASMDEIVDVTKYALRTWF